MMSIDQLEDYMARLFKRQFYPVDDERHLPATYVMRQIEWAESEIQKKLSAQKSSLMAKPAAGGQAMGAR